MVSLQLNNLPHLGVVHDGAIASCPTRSRLATVVFKFTGQRRGGGHTEFLLDDLEDLLLIELLRETLDSRQSLTTIAF